MGQTLSAVLDDARRRGFVGRSAQLRALDAAPCGAGPVRLLFVHGAGGIGKTTLLDELRRRAVAAQRTVVLLDGRDLGGSMDAVEAAVAAAVPEPDGSGADGSASGGLRRTVWAGRVGAGGARRRL